MAFVAALRKLVPRQPHLAPLLPAAPSRLLAPLLPSAPSRLLATTVQQARERIFGWARPSKNFTPFKSLSNLKRKGLKGPSIVRYYPEPSPVAKSLVISRGFNEERIEKNILNRTMGRGPPKKGAGASRPVCSVAAAAADAGASGLRWRAGWSRSVSSAAYLPRVTKGW